MSVNCKPLYQSGKLTLSYLITIKYHFIQYWHKLIICDLPISHLQLAVSPDNTLQCPCGVMSAYKCLSNLSTHTVPMPKTRWSSLELGAWSATCMQLENASRPCKAKPTQTYPWVYIMFSSSHDLDLQVCRSTRDELDHWVKYYWHLGFSDPKIAHHVLDHFNWEEFGYR